jgi:hypothetical protein
MRSRGIPQWPRSSSFTNFCTRWDSARIHRSARRSRNRSPSDVVADTHASGTLCRAASGRRSRDRRPTASKRAIVAIRLTASRTPPFAKTSSFASCVRSLSPPRHADALQQRERLLRSPWPGLVLLLLRLLFLFRLLLLLVFFLVFLAAFVSHAPSFDDYHS